MDGKAAAAAAADERKEREEKRGRKKMLAGQKKCRQGHEIIGELKSGPSWSFYYHLWSAWSLGRSPGGYERTWELELGEMK